MSGDRQLFAEGFGVEVELGMRGEWKSAGGHGPLECVGRAGQREIEIVGVEGVLLLSLIHILDFTKPKFNESMRSGHANM